MEAIDDANMEASEETELKENEKRTGSFHSEPLSNEMQPIRKFKKSPLFLKQISMIQEDRENEIQKERKEASEDNKETNDAPSVISTSADKSNSNRRFKINSRETLPKETDRLVKRQDLPENIRPSKDTGVLTKPDSNSFEDIEPSWEHDGWEKLQREATVHRRNSSRRSPSSREEYHVPRRNREDNQDYPKSRERNPTRRKSEEKVDKMDQFAVNIRSKTLPSNLSSNSIVICAREDGDRLVVQQSRQLYQKQSSSQHRRFFQQDQNKSQNYLREQQRLKREEAELARVDQHTRRAQHIKKYSSLTEEDKAPIRSQKKSIQSHQEQPGKQQGKHMESRKEEEQKNTKEERRRNPHEISNASFSSEEFAFSEEMLSSDRRVILILSIEIQPGLSQPLYIHEGDDADHISEEFCHKHAMEMTFAPYIADQVRENVERILKRREREQSK